MNAAFSLFQSDVNGSIKEISSIRDASAEVFAKMPTEFKSIDFCAKVRKLLKRRTMDGTILRRLRELRADGVCDYEVKDPAMGIYKKV